MDALWLNKCWCNDQSRCHVSRMPRTDGIWWFAWVNGRLASGNRLAFVYWTDFEVMLNSVDCIILTTRVNLILIRSMSNNFQKHLGYSSDITQEHVEYWPETIWIFFIYSSQMNVAHWLRHVDYLSDIFRIFFRYYPKIYKILVKANRILVKTRRMYFRNISDILQIISRNMYNSD